MASIPRPEKGLSKRLEGGSLEENGGLRSSFVTESLPLLFRLGRFRSLVSTASGVTVEN